jgi:flavin reductase (DIM6/NTAB) family NADH-FMN oxidoreductase RutF
VIDPFYLGDVLSVTPPPEPQRLRHTMAQFATGICVLTSQLDGQDCAVTANSVTSVSLEPPLVLACIARGTRFQRSLTTSEHSAISVLDATAEPVARQLASSLPLEEQFGGIDMHRGACTGLLLLDRSLATLECVTEAVYPGGDHLIYLGRVLAASSSGRDTGSLLYHASRYRTLDPAAGPAAD